MPEDVVMTEDYVWDNELCEYVLVRQVPVVPDEQQQPEVDGCAIIV